MQGNVGIEIKFSKTFPNLFYLCITLQPVMTKFIHCDSIIKLEVIFFF